MTSKLETPELLSPFQMADLNLKNRVVLAPLTRGRAGAERMPNELMAEYYAQRASAALIVSGAIYRQRLSDGKSWRVTHGPGEARSPDYRPAAAAASRSASGAASTGGTAE